MFLQPSARIFSRSARGLARECGADAGQVRERGQAMLPLDAIHDHQRLIARAAAGAIGDGAVIRLGLEQGGDLILSKRLRSPSAVFGRENSKETTGRLRAGLAL
jgi:hypothetical protein